MDGMRGYGGFGAGGCATVYGPVANVCYGAVPVMQWVPTTTVTPIPNYVQPSVMMGAPTTAGFGGPGKGGYGKGMPGGKAAVPWGKSVGISAPVPGIYTSDIYWPGGW